MERLDSVSLFATVGIGHMVSSLDRLAKLDSNCFGLPLDMAEPESFRQAQVYR